MSTEGEESQEVPSREEYLAALRELTPGQYLQWKLEAKALLKRVRKNLGIANPRRGKRG